MFSLSTQASDEFVVMSSKYSDKWQWLLTHEHEQRKRLENQFERLAKDHHNLEQVSVHTFHRSNVA